MQTADQYRIPENTLSKQTLKIYFWKRWPLSSSIMIDVTNIELLSEPFQINDIRHLWLFLSVDTFHVLTILKYQSLYLKWFLFLISTSSSVTFIGKVSVTLVFNVYKIGFSMCQTFTSTNWQESCWYIYNNKKSSC